MTEYEQKYGRIKSKFFQKDKSYIDYLGYKFDEHQPLVYFGLERDEFLERCERIIEHNKKYPTCHCGRKYIPIDKAKECFFCSFTRK